MTTGVVRHACRHRVTARGVFVLGGGVVAVCFEGLLRGHVLAGGPASHACRRRSGSTRGFDFFGLGDSFTRSGETARGGFWFGGFFCGWTGSRCGGMCWPRERPATHAAAGAAARGVFGLGGLFHTLRRDGTRGWGGGFLHTLGRDGARRFLVWRVFLHALERRDGD